MAAEVVVGRRLEAGEISRAPAHNARPRARDPEWGGGWRFIWRYRKQLGPFAIAFGLLGTSTYGHLVYRGSHWLTMLGFALVLVLMVKMDRLVERIYTFAVGTAAILWTQTSWWVGIDSPRVLLAWALITAPAAAIWIYHQQPRSRIIVTGGSVWPWHWHRWRFRRHARKELRRVLEEWPWTAVRAKVPGVTVRRAEADIDDPDYVLHLDLHGWTVAHLNQNQKTVGSALRTFTGLTTIEADTYEHHARVIWPRDDPWVLAEDEPEESVELHLVEDEPEASSLQADTA